MAQPRRHPLPALLALLLLALTLTATACGGDDNESTAATGGGGSAKPSKITVAYQAIPNGDLVVKNKKWLEKALPRTKGEGKLVDSGGTINEARAARSGGN